MSCSALSRTSTNTRHLLTICTQKAMRFDKGSCRSRCCGQAGNSLSCPALSRTSLLDSRAKHGNDRGEEKNTGMTEEKKRIRKRQYYFFFCHPRTSAARSGDLWIVGSSPTMTKRKISTNMTEEKKQTRQ